MKIIEQKEMSIKVGQAFRQEVDYIQSTFHSFNFEARKLRWMSLYTVCDMLVIKLNLDHDLTIQTAGFDEDLLNTFKDK